MIRIVVVATTSVDVDPSKHFTTVPFRPMLTEATVTLDISGKTFGPESLENVITEPLIIRGGGIPLGPIDVIGVVVSVVFSGKTVNSHLRKMSDDVHVSSS